MARGDILAFIDDDAYPCEDWLENIVENFKDPKTGGVGGPGITPPDSSWKEQASGWFSASPFGGGFCSHRFLPGKKKFVDDYPSMNFSVRKKDFLSVGGFDSNYWPGEDTKLCLDLVRKLGNKILYDPEVLVFHHRRPLWQLHLRQNGNYGLHRGYFARVLPQTSFRPSYFAPSVLVIFFPILFPLYAIVLFLNALWVAQKSQSVLQVMISFPVVSVTHLWYGVKFLQGFLLTKNLKQ